MRTRHCLPPLLSLALLSLLGPGAASARWPSFGFFFENDTDFLSGVNNDRFYTNGTRIDANWDLCTLPGPLRKRWDEKGGTWIPFVGDAGSQGVCEPGEDVADMDPNREVFGFGLRIGQNLYTPENIDTALLQPRDRPYAAWLYVGASVSKMSPRRMRSLQLDLGVVGPSAFGEEVQDWVHANITDSREAQGWDLQIPDEPALLVTYEERRRYALWTAEHDSGAPVVLFDLVPRLAAQLGNVFTQGTVAASARFGWNLRGFGPVGKLYAIQPHEFTTDLPNRLEAYGFVAAEARGVLHNIFLDGPLFSDSHSVPSKELVTDVEWGFSIRYREVSLTYRRVQRSEEFTFQREPQEFGSVTLSWNLPYKPR